MFAKFINGFYVLQDGNNRGKQQVMLPILVGYNNGHYRISTDSGLPELIWQTNRESGELTSTKAITSVWTFVLFPVSSPNKKTQVQSMVPACDFCNYKEGEMINA